MRKKSNQQQEKKLNNVAPFKKGMSIVACPDAMKDPEKVKQLCNRTRMTADELQAGQIKVVRVVNKSQILIKLEGLASATVHGKFFIPASDRPSA